MNMIRLAKPFYDSYELDALRDVMHEGNVAQGEKTKEFEQMIASACEARGCICVPNATMGIYHALKAWGIGRGDTVVLPALGWPSVSAAITETGAKVAYCDVDEWTYNIDVFDAEKVARKTSASAIVPTHLFGQPCEMDALENLSDDLGLKLIDDAACALGAKYDGIPIGKYGTAVFSFQGRKIVSTGEGGAIVTYDEEIEKNIRMQRDMGMRKRGDCVEFTTRATNMKFSDILATIGIVQMSKLDRMLAERYTITKYYTEQLGDIKNAWTPNVQDDGVHAWQAYVLRLNPGIDRQQVVKDLLERGIETRRGSYCIPSTGAYTEKHTCEVAEELGNSLLAIPLWNGMKKSVITEVVNMVREVLA
jgi:dTDP-4-amino-4,6-dideoxygalactose transaminase